ncbi:MAG TPA: hypothetical protein VKU01_08720 [Bryobacteraceae bacterium]|nr:hypothetical protein [Bryobacteraceae bacterium]
MKNTLYVIGLFVGLTLSLHAQNTGANDIGDFTLELLIPLNGINSLTPPNVPDTVLAAIAGGTLEVHQQYSYDSAHRLLSQVSFVLPANSPIPTPSLDGITLNDRFAIQVTSVNVTNSPKPAVILAGTVTSMDVPTPFGSNLGAGYSLAFAYQGGGDTTQYGPIMESTTGMYSIFAPSGIGSLSLTPTAHGCSVATIQGSYMYTQSGSTLDSAGNSHPYVDNGRLVVDGQGSGMVIGGGNGGGKPSTESFPVTYTLDNNCTGNINLGHGATMSLEASKDGKRIQFLWTAPASFVVSGTGYLQ